MNEFVNALISKGKSNLIPDEHDLFGKVVGEWDIVWTDNIGTDKERHINGEWIFAWILDGTAIQDIFIVPSRSEMLMHEQKDAEYGTTIRIYNPLSTAWDIFYGCTGSAKRLEARKVDDRVELTELSEQKMKWVFSDITSNGFHWQKIISEDGENLKIEAELYATRKKEA